MVVVEDSVRESRRESLLVAEGVIQPVLGQGRRVRDMLEESGIVHGPEAERDIQV